MTQDEMIDLAKQAGWQYAHGESGFEPLWAFAKLVAAKEREACAKVCESNVFNKDIAWWQRVTKSEVSFESSMQCAKAIRARGQA